MPTIANAQTNGPIRLNKEAASERKGEKRGARGIPTTDVPACFMADLCELYVARSSQTLGPLFLNLLSSFVSIPSV
jgi:hypothetical protein